MYSNPVSEFNIFSVKQKSASTVALGLGIPNGSGGSPLFLGGAARPRCFHCAVQAVGGGRGDYFGSLNCSTSQPLSPEFKIVSIRVFETDAHLPSTLASLSHQSPGRGDSRVSDRRLWVSTWAFPRRVLRVASVPAWDRTNHRPHLEKLKHKLLWSPDFLIPAGGLPWPALRGARRVGEPCRPP